ncbi:YEATS domain-containing protein 2-like isoform X2 [Ornithodoros turicata]|uniref:YEATS domain-containing protein 2-like isoform X2 n=1 Tax=Ornithodoros turicata TaxID=34597 RepID=UPI00313A183A
MCCVFVRLISLLKRAYDQLLSSKWRKQAAERLVMSATQKRLLDQDPDYESVPLHAQQKRLKLHEQDAKKATIKTIEQIIKTQFSQEISTREAELDTINQRIYEAQALLDSLRVSIVTKYYATGGRLLSEQSPDGCPPSAQVHPTVKKYLGKSVPRLPRRDDHVAAPKPGVAKVPNVPVPQLEKRSQPEASVTLNKPIVQGPRSKNKIRIIVGNVSKYIPSDKRDPNDHATHKWMVYVRCPPNGGAEIAQVVRKVRFFLHPSYRPNDMVVVSEAPFHLVRKGWGEFPLRLQLHFCDRRNKPVDIIHNLKLDKTYTGLQTLGAETVVDLWMASNQSQGSPDEGVNVFPSQALQVKVEQTEMDKDTSCDTHVLHSQCSQAAAVSDHVYSEPATSEGATEPSSRKPNGNRIEHQNSETHAHQESHQDIVAPTENVQTESVGTMKDKQGQHSEAREDSGEIVRNFAILSRSESIKTEGVPQATQALPVSSSTVKHNSTVPKPQTSPVAGTSLLLQNNTASSPPPTTQSKNVANGARTQSFVKCTDALGRVLLIPSTSLLRPKAAVVRPQEPMAGSKRLPSILKNNVLRPILPRNSVCSSSGAPRMQTPSSVQTSSLQTPSTSGQASSHKYTLLVVPSVDKAHSQILLVPTTSLVNKAPVSTPPATSQTSSVVKDCSVSKPVPQPQQQALVRKKDPVEILQKKLHSIRLCDYKNYNDALLAVAPLFPLSDVDMDEKMACFPFAATSSAAYFSWPVPKRRASEWLRASAVRKGMQALLEKQNPDWCSLQQIWSTKRTMLWCRRFGFTPLHADAEVVSNEDRMHSEYVLPGGTYTDPKALLDALRKQLPDQLPCCESQGDEEVDVETVDEDGAGDTSRGTSRGASPKKSSQSPRMELPLSDCALFVRESAAEIGVHTSFVEVEPFVDGPVVEEIILSACKRFASTILRHSVNAAHERAGKNLNPDMVKVEDVYKALLNLSFCDFLTNSNLGIEVTQESIDDSAHL